MIATHIESILIITGALTAIALIQFISPSQSLRMIYGETPTFTVSLVLARHWGLLTFCIGVLLIYAAFHPPLRDPAMVFGATEKVALGAGLWNPAPPVTRCLVIIHIFGIAVLYLHRSAKGPDTGPSPVVFVFRNGTASKGVLTTVPLRGRKLPLQCGSAYYRRLMFRLKQKPILDRALHDHADSPFASSRRQLIFGFAMRGTRCVGDTRPLRGRNWQAT